MSPNFNHSARRSPSIMECPLCAANPCDCARWDRRSERRSAKFTRCAVRAVLAALVAGTFAALFLEALNLI